MGDGGLLKRERRISSEECGEEGGSNRDYTKGGGLPKKSQEMTGGEGRGWEGDHIGGGDLTTIAKTIGGVLGEVIFQKQWQSSGQR